VVTDPPAKRALPVWAVAVLVATVVLAVAGWTIDHRLDHPIAARPDLRAIAVIDGGTARIRGDEIYTVPSDVQPATVVAVTAPGELLVDVTGAPMIGQPGDPAPGWASQPGLPLPLGRTRIVLVGLSAPAAGDCHAAAAQRLAEHEVQPGAHVLVRGADRAQDGATGFVWVNGQLLNRRLLLVGAASYLSQPDWLGAVMAAAERTAQDGPLGVWSPCRP
jgi:hypothetical protein